MNNYPKVVRYLNVPIPNDYKTLSLLAFVESEDKLCTDWEHEVLKENATDQDFDDYINKMLIRNYE